uniref:Decapping nuclease n=1 Tax=Strongyloides venezuelensis TaxID=75913 RepID=A0A0K0G003_STRVS
MNLKSLNDYISKPKYIAEISLDKSGNVLNEKAANKCYFTDRFINQDIFYINLKSPLLSYEDRTKEMEINSRRNILQSIKRSNCTLKDSLYGAEIYCSSGVLKKFATSHLQNNIVDVWCTKIDGVIIMVEDRPSEIGQQSTNGNVKHSGSDFKSSRQRSQCFQRSYSFERNLKFAAFLKENPLIDKAPFVECNQAWKQYRRVYIADLKNPHNPNDKKSLRVAYNSIIHCVDKNKDKPVVITTRPSSIEGINFVWRSDHISKLYMQSILLDSDQVVVGEWDKNHVIRRIRVKSTQELFRNNNFKEKTLYENLWYVINQIQRAFENDGEKRIKCLHLVKRNGDDKFHAKCFSNIPKHEACVGVFEDF